MATTAAERRRRAQDRRRKAGNALSTARTKAGEMRTRLTTDTYRCAGCGESLGTASELAAHACSDGRTAASGGTTKGKAKGKPGEGKVKAVAAEAVRSAVTRRRSGRVAHPALHALIKASQQFTEVDLVDGKGRALMSSDELDDMWSQLGSALTTVGDNLDGFADRLDRELRLDRRVVMPFRDAADSVGADARERVRDARKALRRVYADRLTPGGRGQGPASGFLPS